MSKRTEAILIERQTNDQSLSGQWLLSFLDRNLSKFSRWVRNTIGLTVLALLVVVLLHGAIAPTYVEGRLFIGDTENEPPQLAKGYFLTLSGGQEFLTNENGCWMLPVRGFFPHKIRVDLLDSGKKRLDKFAFWAPWPVLSALSVSVYNVEVRPYLGVDNLSRVQVTTTNLGVPLADSLFRIAASLSPVATVHAQPSAAAWQRPYIKAHLQDIGDIGCRDGSWCGTRGESRRLEGFAISLTQRAGNVRLEYLCRSEAKTEGTWLSEGEYLWNSRRVPQASGIRDQARWR